MHQTKSTNIRGQRVRSVHQCKRTLCACACGQLVIVYGHHHHCECACRLRSICMYALLTLSPVNVSCDSSRIWRTWRTYTQHYLYRPTCSVYYYSFPRSHPAASGPSISPVTIGDSCNRLAGCPSITTYRGLSRCTRLQYRLIMDDLYSRD